MSIRETELVDSGPAVNAAGLVHRVRLPDVPAPRPAVIMLHGRSGDEDAMWVFDRTLPADWLAVAPRGPEPDVYGGFAWRPRARDEWPSLSQFDAVVTAVARFTHALPELYGADPKRTCLMGFSQGAATGYATAMRHPGIFRSIAGLVGFVPGECGQETEAAVLADLPILMIVGRRDPFIPLARSQECARVLRSLGADLDYQEYDVGHKLNAAGFRHLTEWWRQRARTGAARPR